MKSVLLDTNTLLLYLVGNLLPGLIGSWRLSAFDREDLERLNGFLGDSDRHVSLPNVLTEVSNLIGSGKQLRDRKVLDAFRAYCGFLDEIYEPSAAVVQTKHFERLGLTDAAILRMSRGAVTVFTVDFDLFGILSAKGVEVVNLMHFKTP